MWTATTVAAVAVFQGVVPPAAPGTTVSYWTVAGVDVIARTPGGTDVLGFMPVVPMTIGSALLMMAVSLVTTRPSQATLEKYF